MQFGDLATRIARAFRVRGRIPLKLDEMVVPVSVVQSIDQDPFRTEPITWTAVAGSTVAPLPAPPLGQVLVSAYSSQVGALGQVTISRNTGLGAFVPPVPGFVTALNRDAPGVVAAAAPALQLLIDSQPVLPIGQPIYQPVASEQFTRFPDPVVLFPGDFFILSGPTDESIGSATFFGQEFPPLT
jgi:hypothetical protein